MNISDLLHETYSALTGNKVRTALTMLGIVIGIGSVIALVSIGQGAQNAIQSSIEGLGANLLTVFPGVIQPGRGLVSSGRGSAQSLTNADAAALKEIEGVASISPELSRRFQVVAQTGNNTNTTVYGVAPDYESAHNVMITDGSFINETQMRSLGRVAVIGPTTATDLFGDNDPFGQNIRINGVTFHVIGVTVAKGSSGLVNQDDAVYIPLTTMQKILVGGDYVSNIAISVSSKDLMDQVKYDTISLLAVKHKVDPASPDFSVISQAEIAGALNSVTSTFTLFLAFIASISLLVGGIGIMNMMLTTVTERTKEIGLRKAIGAKKRDISRQFLVEAVVLTLLGGIAGIAMGWIISMLVSKFAGIATSVSPMAVLLACGVSTAIGIIFGYYPATRAAKLNPIEALRYE